jgi:hypothetical protein
MVCAGCTVWCRHAQINSATEIKNKLGWGLFGPQTVPGDLGAVGYAVGNSGEVGSHWLVLDHLNPSMKETMHPRLHHVKLGPSAEYCT